MHEPDSQSDYSENSPAKEGFYSWDGKLIGAGKVLISKSDAGRAIHQQIEFLRPSKR